MMVMSYPRTLRSSTSAVAWRPASPLGIYQNKTVPERDTAYALEIQLRPWVSAPETSDRKGAFMTIFTVLVPDLRREPTAITAAVVLRAWAREQNPVCSLIATAILNTIDRVCTDAGAKAAS